LLARRFLPGGPAACVAQLPSARKKSGCVCSGTASCRALHTRRRRPARQCRSLPVQSRQRLGVRDPSDQRWEGRAIAQARRWGRSRLVIIRGAGRPDHSKSISPIQAEPMPAIAAAFDSPQWKRPPYLAPLSRGRRCRLRSLHGIRPIRAPWPMMPVFRAPGSFLHCACFTRHGPSNTACRGARPRVLVTKLAYLSPRLIRPRKLAGVTAQI
jgi:hypothetical protein